jgi:hypothetical protein
MTTKKSGRDGDLSRKLPKNGKQETKTMRWSRLDEFPPYEVSDTGLVRNSETGLVLVPSSNGHGITKVTLRKDGETVTRTVPRLVGEEFVDGYEEGDVIFHIDNDKSNAEWTNLLWKPRWFAQEWATQLKRTKPMREWAIKMMPTQTDIVKIYSDSLACALDTFGIEKYIILACGRGSFYNRATYEWIRD